MCVKCTETLDEYNEKVNDLKDQMVLDAAELDQLSGEISGLQSLL